LLWVFISSLGPDLQNISPENLQIAQTRLFLVLIFFELVLALSCRSLKYTIIKARPHKLLIGTILWEIALILLIVNVPFLRESFSLAPIGLYEVLLIAGLSALVLLTIEITNSCYTIVIQSSLKHHLPQPTRTINQKLVLS